MPNQEIPVSCDAGAYHEGHKEDGTVDQEGLSMPVEDNQSPINIDIETKTLKSLEEKEI